MPYHSAVNGAPGATFGLARFCTARSFWNTYVQYSLIFLVTTRLYMLRVVKSPPPMAAAGLGSLLVTPVSATARSSLLFHNKPPTKPQLSWLRSMASQPFTTPPTRLV